MNPHQGGRHKKSDLRLPRPDDSPSAGIQTSPVQAGERNTEQLVAELRDDLSHRWRHGERIRAEWYLERYPTLNDALEYAVDLVYCEFLLREDLGERPEQAEYLRRFPQFAQQLERQFALHDELAAAASSPSDGSSRANAAEPVEAPPAAAGGHRSLAGLGPPASRLGRFEIKEQLGVGGFGSVYRAYDPQLGRDVALKVPHAHLLTDDRRDRFLREARAAAQLQHPNLVAVYDFDASREACYIAYQFVPGQTLAEALTERTFDATQTAQLVRKLAQAAHYAHTKGVFHRDLKTANVLIDSDGEPYISDFGLVRLEGDTTLTADSTVLGTPAYMSPEQAQGASHQADARSDVYTLGVVLYELLTGRLPFGGTAQSVLRQLAEQDPPRLRSVSRHVPKDLETICLKAMAKRPADRYPSAQHLADDLGRWLRHEPIQARPSSLWTLAIKFARRRPAAAALVAVLAVALGTLFLVGTWYDVRLRIANSETTRLLAQTRLLLSQAQAERGVQLLEAGDSAGLLHLLEARKTAEEIPQARMSRSLLWAGWYDACAGRLQQVLGDDGQAESVTFSPDGKLLAVVSDQGARLWDTATGKQLGDLFPHCRHEPVAFAPDGTFFVTAPRGDAPRLWESATGRPAAMQLESLDSTGPFALSPDGSLLAVGAGSDVWVGDTSTGAWYVKSLRHGGEVGNCMAFSRDGKWLATTSRSGTHGVARLWRIRKQAAAAEPVGKLIVHAREITALAFSPDGTLLATASLDDTARLWDTATAEPRGSPMRHREAVWTLAFSKDGKMLATGSFDGTAQLWDSTTANPLLRVPLRHQGPVRAIDFSPDDKLVATGSFDGTVRLWDRSSGQPYTWPLRHPGDVTSVVFSPDGTRLASASSAGSARIWNVLTEQSADGAVFQHDSRVYALALSPNDGKLLATGSGDGSCRLWDTATASPVFDKPWQGPGEVLTAAISIDGLLAIGWTSASKSIVEFRDTKTGDRVGEPINSHDALRVLTFSPDGKILATGAAGGAVDRWEVPTGRRHGRSFRHKVGVSDQPITTLAFSPDGKLLASGSADRTVQLWEVETGKQHCPFLWHEGSVEALAFSPDGKTLATASRDLTIRFWDTATGQALPQTIRPQVIVQSLAFGPDGRLLATASIDGVARLWDVETGLSCGLPFTHDAPATSVTFSPDGRWLATASFDKTARLWRLPRHLGEFDLAIMQLRTWVHLGARFDQGILEAIPSQEWRQMQEELSSTQR